MKPHSIAECVNHIMWTIANSPKAFADAREPLHDLRVAIVNAELRHKEESQTAHQRRGNNTANPNRGEAA